MNRKIMILTALCFLSFQSIAYKNDPAIIEPKNRQTIKDSDNYTSLYLGCAKSEAARYSKTGESAESIAKASVTSCNWYITKITNANIYWLNMSASDQATAVAKLRSMANEVAIKSVMDEKRKRLDSKP